MRGRFSSVPCLRGRVLPIGGLKEKILAAKRAGLKRVILPRRNQKDLDEVPKQIRRGLEFIFVETMDEVLPAALRASETQATIKHRPVRLRAHKPVTGTAISPRIHQEQARAEGGLESHLTGGDCIEERFRLWLRKGR